MSKLFSVVKLTTHTIELQGGFAVFLRGGEYRDRDREVLERKSIRVC